MTANESSGVDVLSSRHARSQRRSASFGLIHSGIVAGLGGSAVSAQPSQERLVGLVFTALSSGWS
jgi:hypothetical protein